MYKKRVLKTYVKTLDVPVLDPIGIFSAYVPDHKGIFMEINGSLGANEGAITPNHGHILISRIEGQSLLLRNDVTAMHVNGRTIEANGKYLNTLRLIMDKVTLANDHLLPFAGGVIGTMGYEIAKQHERISDDNPDDLKVPDAHLVIVEAFISIDTSSRQVKTVVLESPDPSGEKRAQEKLQDMANALHSGAEVSTENQHKGASPDRPTGLKSNIDKDGFMKNVTKCKDYIAAGDIFQTVLSQRLEIPMTQNSFDVFQNLRRINPSPYMYYMNFGDYQVIGSSPEMLVKCRDGLIETCPIAGSVERGRNEAEDKKKAELLLHDEKELAEHAMLVDLARNDIGRFSKVGSVTLSKFMEVQKFSHIQHLVSTVEGIQADGVHPLDVLAGFIPAGTLSGAPKIRAMEIIEELENTHRGVYGGAIGCFDYNGNLDTCIAIRTMIVKDGIGYVQAGAGIVMDSIPDKEYEETMNKATALISAVKGGQQ